MMPKVICDEDTEIQAEFPAYMSGKVTNRALGQDVQGADVVVVDEVGPFELSGGGWARALDALEAFDGVTILVVRESVVEAVRARWGSADTTVYGVSAADPDEIANGIAGQSANC